MGHELQGKRAHEAGEIVVFQQFTKSLLGVGRTRLSDVCRHTFHVAKSRRRHPANTGENGLKLRGFKLGEAQGSEAVGFGAATFR